MNIPFPVLVKTQMMKKKSANFILLMIDCPCLARFESIAEWSRRRGKRTPAELTFTYNTVSYNLRSACIQYSLKWFPVVKTGSFFKNLLLPLPFYNR